MKARIGIMPESMFRERVMAIVRGDYVPEKGEPEVWFSSLTALGQILNNDNIALLRMIENEEPQSITALAKLSGRELSNLSITLSTLEKHGFVKKVKGKNAIKPVALFTDFEIVTQQFPGKKQPSAA